MYTLCSAVFPYFNLRDWISIWKSDSVFPIQFKDESEVMSGKFTIEVTEQWLYVNSVYGLSASSYFGETSEKIIIWEFSQMADPSSIGKPLLKFVFLHFRS